MVKRAGEVIPKIVRVVEEVRVEETEMVEIRDRYRF
jgi:NAD-dependent DNA ligase